MECPIEAPSVSMFLDFLCYASAIEVKDGLVMIFSFVLCSLCAPFCCWYYIYAIRNYCFSVRPDTYSLYVVRNIYSIPKSVCLSEIKFSDSVSKRNPSWTERLEPNMIHLITDCILTSIIHIFQLLLQHILLISGQLFFLHALCCFFNIG